MLTQQEFVLGHFLIYLLADPGEWIYRRVESIRFRDDCSIRRQISFDFKLDRPSAADLALIDDAFRVPLTMLEKRVLQDFDLKDATGRSIPLLTKHQNGDLISNALIAGAEETLNTGLKTDELSPIANEIGDLVYGTSAESQEIINGWKASDANSADKTVAARAGLAANDGYMGFCEMLVGQFVLMADYDALDGRRHILKMSYNEPLGSRYPDGGWVRRWLFPRLESTGWRFRVVGLFAHQIALAQSAHLEVSAPPDLSIERAALVFAGESPEDRMPVEDYPESDRAHLYAPDVTYEDQAQLQVFLRPERSGVPRAAFLLSLGVFALLGIFMLLQFTSTDLVRDHQSASTLLLLAPSLFAAFAIRPGEHRLASKLVFGIRLLVLLDVALSTLASIILMIEQPLDPHPSEILGWAWGSLFVCSGVIAAALMGAGQFPLMSANTFFDSRRGVRVQRVEDDEVEEVADGAKTDKS